MAKNTGFQQAVYAARFTAKGEIPLDKDGNFCSISGAKQAIILLEGHDNPNPSKYEVVGSFKEGDVIDDYPSMVYNTEACPLPEPEYTLPDYAMEPIESRYFEVRPLADDLLSDQTSGMESRSFNTIYNRDWDDPNGTDNALSGFYDNGINQETLKVRRIGEYYWTLENFKFSYIENGQFGIYRLNQSQLDNAGIDLTVAESYDKNGVFCYAAYPSNVYMKKVAVYPNRKLPIGVNPNLFDKTKLLNIINDRDAQGGAGFNMTKSSDWATFIIPTLLFQSNLYNKLTIWREDPENTEIRISRSYNVYSNSENTQYSGAIVHYGNDQTITDGLSSTYTPTNWFLSVKLNGRTIDELPKIKVEFGDKFTGWVECFENTKETQWEVPAKADFLQLFGMVGQDLSYLNLRKNLFVKPIDKDIPWIDNYQASQQCEDLLGARFLPIGHKNNGTTIGVNGSDGEIYNYGQRVAFLTKDENLTKPTDSSASLYMTDVKLDVKKNVFWDFWLSTGSCTYWQKNIRLCRALTDEELGYRLWVDEANNKILVTALADPQPANTTELEKGLLRGLAVRWMNEDKTKVLASLSKLQAEIEKTKNDGEYSWYGFYE